MAGERLTLRALVDSGARKGEPAWLSRLREERLAFYRETGLPTTRNEDWKYTNLAALGPIEEIESAALATAEVKALGIPSAAKLVFVGGRFDPGRSELGGLPSGIEIRPLSHALESSERWFTGYPLDREDATKALNTAYFTDGAWIHVKAGAHIDRPIHLIHVSTSGRAAFLRHVIAIERGAQASFVEEYLGPKDGADARMTNVVTQLRLLEGSQALHLRLQSEGGGAVHLSDLFCSQARDSRLDSVWVSLGAAVARNEVHAGLFEPNAEASLLGLYCASGKEQAEGFTVIDHASPECRSEEFYKGLLRDESKGAFTGRIVVRKDAQKTDSRQLNRNLLLSDTAVANTRPQLQIHADDVKCAHGATIGRLDPEQLFYLRSRGVDRKTASKLVSQAFAGEVVERLADEGLRAAVQARVAAWLEGAC
jgi:Fe-S cluster assembly protein SufD